MFVNKIRVTRETSFHPLREPVTVEVEIDYTVGDNEGALRALNEAYAEARQRIEAK